MMAVCLCTHHSQPHLSHPHNCPLRHNVLMLANTNHHTGKTPPCILNTKGTQLCLHFSLKQKQTKENIYTVNYFLFQARTTAGFVAVIITIIETIAYKILRDTSAIRASVLVHSASSNCTRKRSFRCQL